MEPMLQLRDASVQELQLELIRRSSFNAFDGERVYQSLLKHRALWKGVMLTRPGLPNYQKPGELLMTVLVPLRDLEHNLWNADMLFVLTPSPVSARELAGIVKAEDWGGEVTPYNISSTS